MNDKIYFDVKVKEKKDYALFKLKGKLDAYVLSKLENEFANQFANGNYCIILDCSELLHLSSTAVGMLINRLKRCKQKSGNILLTNVNSNILRVLSILGAEKIFEIFDDLKEAEAVFLKKSI